MPIGAGAERFPPPWLIAMQRYGPPPSYPNLKIPGLNAAIPEGCSFGYHAGTVCFVEAASSIQMIKRSRWARLEWWKWYYAIRDNLDSLKTFALSFFKLEELQGVTWWKAYVLLPSLHFVMYFLIFRRLGKTTCWWNRKTSIRWCVWAKIWWCCWTGM